MVTHPVPSIGLVLIFWLLFFKCPILPCPRRSPPVLGHLGPRATVGVQCAPTPPTHSAQLSRESGGSNQNPCLGPVYFTQEVPACLPSPNDRLYGALRQIQETHVSTSEQLKSSPGHIYIRCHSYPPPKGNDFCLLWIILSKRDVIRILYPNNNWGSESALRFQHTQISPPS